jgi:hypothetical protein
MFRCMTRSVLSSMVLLATAGSASAAIVAADDFNAYPDGSIVGQGAGTGWSSSWIKQGNGVATVAEGKVTTNDEGVRRSFPTIQATGVVYYGVDMTFNADAASTSRYAGISSMDFGSERIKFGKTWSETNFSFDGHNGSHSTGITIVPGVTYRIVASIQWDTSGGNGKLKMWVNPDLADYDIVLGTGSADASTSYGSSGNWNDGIRLASGGSGIANVTYDNLIIASSFAEAAAIPEPNGIVAFAVAGMALLQRRGR